LNKELIIAARTYPEAEAAAHREAAAVEPPWMPSGAAGQ
jgi:hypothetical protein